MGKELLASKIIFNDAEPGQDSTAPAPSTIACLVGTTERGVMGVATLVTGWTDFVKQFGGHYTGANLPMQVWEFYKEAGIGASLYIIRTCHYANPAIASSLSALNATGYITAGSAVALSAIVLGTNAVPFNLTTGDTLDIQVDGGGTLTATFTATRATITSGSAETYNITTNVILSLKIDGGTAQDIDILVANLSSGVATAQEIVNELNASLIGASATLDGAGTSVVITSDSGGTDSEVEITGGTANVTLGFSTVAVNGTGNVADIDGVTGAEVKSIVEAAVAGTTVTEIGGVIQIKTTATGIGHTIQVMNTSVNADGIMGLDNLLHTGADSGIVNVLQTDSVDPGAFGNTLQVQILASSSGEATEFNLYVLKNGFVVERHADLTMTDTETNYVLTVVNRDSIYIELTDLAVGTRPTNQTNTAQTGGDDGLVGIVDADYIGDKSAQTGIYAADTVERITEMSIPIQTSVIHNALWTYFESDRNGLIFGVFTIPLGYTAVQAREYVKTTASLYNATDTSAIFYPRIYVTNQNKAVYGDTDTYLMSLEGAMMGLIAKVRATTGGVYKNPAGTVDGKLITCLGVEGGATAEVLDVNKRDIIYPARINPIHREEGSPWYCDGHRTLSDNTVTDFPNISDRLGRSQIEIDVHALLLWVKHKKNTAKVRERAYNQVYNYMLTQAGLDAFVSKDPALAFRVDTSTGINTTAVQRAGKFLMDLAFKFADSIDWVIVNISRDVEPATGI
jgi:hypothetical protein